MAMHKHLESRLMCVLRKNQTRLMLVLDHLREQLVVLIEDGGEI
jgi:hypothetical protein